MGGDDWSKRGGVQGEEEGSKDGALWDASGELAGVRHIASPGDLVGSSRQVGRDPLKCSASDAHLGESGEQDPMVNRIKCCREVQQNDDG